MTCLAVKINLVVYEGGTFDQTFQWKSGDTPVAVDLTGYTGKMEIRAKITDPDPPLITAETGTVAWEADCATGIYFDDALDGKYRVYLKDDDTLGMCESHKDIEGVYDLFLYSSDGEAVLKQYGKCKICAAVTR